MTMKKRTQDTLEKEKASERYVGVFPFAFDENADDEAAIPATIQVLPIGQWEHDVYGPIVIASSDIREFAQNFNANIRKGVPITAGHEGMQELPAVGWIKQVEARPDGLWGTVEWNEIGEQALSDRQYKFFSPEFYAMYEDPESHQLYRNVLTGGALTKAPYFKELEAIVFSEKALKKQFNEPTMTIQELVAKKPEDLTAEEKTFLNANLTELTDEQKTAFASVIEAPAPTAEEVAAKEAADKAAADAKATEDANVAAGKNADGTDKVAASEKVQISASELKALRSKADEGAKAFAELNRAKVVAAVSTMTFSESNKNGKFLPKSKDTLQAFIETLNEGQKAKFSELVGQLPQTQIFKELGVDSKAAEGTVQAEVDAKVGKKMSENKELKYSEALRQVFAETEGLTARYDAELQGQVNA